ncbi:FUSC family protein [Parvibaculum sedimenti]|nr:FUSC family protein [Parvibaculum sedimenti]
MFELSRWLFAVKLYIAAMIAFSISVRIGLPQTYWTIVTCCVVMNPLTGAIRSKAVYRFTGTLCAGVISLLLAGVFGSEPLLLIVAAGFIGAGTFGSSVLDRSPRGYGFQLFGLTLMIVAVGGIDNPGNMFATAVARLSEIGLGIICCTVVDSVIAPRSLGPTLRQRLRSWRSDMQNWIADSFRGQVLEPKAAEDRLKIIADVTALSVLAAHLRYDPLVSRRERELTFAMQRRVLRLVPTLAATASRIVGANDAERTVLASVLEEANQYAQDGRAADSGLVARLRDATSSIEPSTPWRQLVREDLTELVTDALRIWAEVRQLDAALNDDAVLEPKLERQVRGTKAFPLRPDPSAARRLAIAALLGYSVLCVLWWATGWEAGSGAVLIGVVALAFFGGVDEAEHAIATFGRFAAFALLFAGILSYGLLPMADNFPSFLIAMAIFMLPLGAWAATNPQATLLMALGLSTINLQGTYSPLNFGAFLEAGFASLLGVFVAYSCIGLLGRSGTAQALLRLTQMERADIVKLSYRATEKDRDDYIDRALDRLGSIIPRLGAVEQTDQSARLLSWLRAGVNIADLRRSTESLAGSARLESEYLLDALRQEIGSAELSPALLARIDHMLTAAWKEAPDPSHHAFIRSLIRLRLALFENGPQWVPAT